MSNILHFSSTTNPLSPLFTGAGATGPGQSVLTDLVEGATGATGATGAGVSGATGAVPDASVPEAYTAVIASLDSVLPKGGMSDQDMLALIALIAGKLKDIETKSGESTASIDSLIKQGYLASQQKQLAQAQQQIAAAASANQDSSVWDKVKLAFQILAAVVMVAVGAVLCATGAGAAVGAFMIAAGVFTLAAAINSTVQSATGTGIMGDIVTACGGSAEQASKADMGFGIAMAAMAVIYSIAGCCMGVGELDLAAQVATIAGDVTNGVSAVVGGVGTVISTVDSYNATEDNANADDDNATAKGLAAFATEIDSFINILIQRLAGINKTFDATLGSIQDALTHHGATMTQATLTA